MFKLLIPWNIFCSASLPVNRRGQGDEERAGKSGWTNELPARLPHADDNNHLFFTKTLQENDMFQGWSHTPKQDEPRNHPINSLFVRYRRQPCHYKVAAGWRSTDRYTQIGCIVSSTAYVTWWVIGSAGVGQDWCKRVWGQAEISCL